MTAKEMERHNPGFQFCLGYPDYKFKCQSCKRYIESYTDAYGVPGPYVYWLEPKPKFANKACPKRLSTRSKS